MRNERPEDWMKGLVRGRPGVVLVAFVRRSVVSVVQAIKEYPSDASCCDVKLLIAPLFEAEV